MQKMNGLTTRLIVACGFIISLVLFSFESSAEPKKISVFHSKTCGCCLKWISYLKGNGFEVEAHAVDDMTTVKDKHKVSGELASCHTAKIDNYVLEGHVPVAAIRKLLQERPAIDGLAVPGMPMGSPGMEGMHSEKYDVLAFRKSEKKTFMTFVGKISH